VAIAALFGVRRCEKPFVYDIELGGAVFSKAEKLSKNINNERFCKSWHAINPISLVAIALVE
jgi:hypothetical protein